jgi:PAS domain S-box-containing protein
MPRSALTIGAVFTVFALAMGWMYVALASANGYQRDIGLAQALRAHVLRLQLDQESGLRGYLSTGRRSFLGPYAASAKAFSPTLADLGRVIERIGLRDSLGDTVRTEGSLHDRWSSEVAKPLLRDPQRRDRPSIESRGKGLVDRLRVADLRIYQSLLRAAATSDDELRLLLGRIIVVAYVLALIVAAFVLALTQRQRELERDVQLLEESRALADSTPSIFFAADAEGRVTFFSRRWEDETGRAAAESLGIRWTQAVHPDDRVAAEGAWGAAVRSGTEFVNEFRLLGRDGVYRWYLVRSSPLHDQRRRVTKWFGTATNIDEMKRTAERETFLAEAGRVLASSLDAQDTLRNAARISVPFLADDARISLAERAVQDGDVDQIAAEVIRTGRSQLDAASGSTLVVPLRTRGRTLGAATFSFAGSGRRYSESDVALAEEFARRAAIAYGNALLYETERREAARNVYVVERLQELFVPSGLPLAEGLSFDAVYQPAEEEALVGGDWYDAFPLSDDLLLFAIGDVAGHGIQAAVTMGRCRQSIVTMAANTSDPAEILSGVNRVMRLQESIVTALVGIIDLRTNEVTYASAGHPPPMLVNAQGSARSLETGGIVLGVLDEARYEPVRIYDLTGSSLVLYTDGLVEFGRDLATAEERLLHVVSRVVGSRSPSVAADVMSAMLGDSKGADDIAVLCITFVGSPVAARMPSFDTAFDG